MRSITLILEFSYTFPLTFGAIGGMVQVEEYDSTLLLQPALDDYMAIVNMPYLSFQADPGTLFEIEWLAGIGQQNQETLMPVYDERFIGGDIANIPYQFLQLFANAHFGPDGDDTFQGPVAFEISEGPSDFELRTPE